MSLLSTEHLPSLGLASRFRFPLVCSGVEISVGELCEGIEADMTSSSRWPGAMQINFRSQRIYNPTSAPSPHIQTQDVLITSNLHFKV